MKTKLQVALKALEPASKYLESGFSKEEVERQIKELGETNSCDPEYALLISFQKALAEIKSMPEENCWNCKSFRRYQEMPECVNQSGLPCFINETDFCSRFEPKEK